MRVALVVLFLLLAPLAEADSGQGDFDHSKVNDVLTAINARSLDQIGIDVIRFSTTPALGGRAWTVELHRVQDGTAAGTATFGYWRRGDWDPLGSLKLGLSKVQYDKLAARIDGLLVRGEPASDPHNVVVCADGPGYLTERRKNIVSTWLSGFCGIHPNNAIAKLMLQVVWE